MNIETFISNFAENLPGLDPDSVKEDTIFRDLPVWDSLAVLMTLAMLDADYQVSLSANELGECETITDLFHRVREKRNLP